MSVAFSPSFVHLQEVCLVTRRAGKQADRQAGRQVSRQTGTSKRVAVFT